MTPEQTVLECIHARPATSYIIAHRVRELKCDSKYEGRADDLYIIGIIGRLRNAGLIVASQNRVGQVTYSRIHHRTAQTAPSNTAQPQNTFRTTEWTLALLAAAEYAENIRQSTTARDLDALLSWLLLHLTELLAIGRVTQCDPADEMCDEKRALLDP